MKLILASQSPQRRAMLKQLGLDFESTSAEIEEIGSGPPRDAVIENARRKALAVADPAANGTLVIGADTLVALDGRIRGKPADAEEARAHLRALSGRTHEVLTGLTILGPSRDPGAVRERSGVELSRVTFRRLDDPLIDRYLASEEWRDRAGAYAVQGLGSTLVDRVDGELANVIGLPVQLLLRLAPELR